MKIEIELEVLIELVARAVVKIQAEQAPKVEPLGWQSSEVVANILGMTRCTLNNKRDLLRINQDYRLIPGVRTRYQYHVENCQKKLKRN